MSAEPYTLAASLSLPPDVGQPLEVLDYSFTGSASNAVRHKLDLTGSGTHVVGFGAIPAAGAKVIFLEYDNLAPGNLVINLVINGGDPIPVSPGGFFAYSNPTPASGVTSLSIVYTAACTVRVTLLG
jgi:hypothetical protein